MSDDQPPIDMYDGLAPSPEAKAAAERDSRANDRSGLPPQNLEAEEALLGAMLMSASAIQEADQLGIQAHHFYRPSHRLVFDAIHAVRSDGAIPDELLVIDKLRATELEREHGDIHGSALVRVGGPSSVMSLVERVPAVANAGAYAKEVRATWVNRRLVEIGHETARIGGDTTIAPDDGVNQAEALLLEVVTGAGAQHERGESMDGTSAMDAWEAAYDLRSQAEEDPDALGWGRPELDERLGQMRRGALFVVAGWTKHGKTWFVLDVAEAVMNAGHRVLFDSMEMSKPEILDRLMAMGGHNLTAVEEGRIPWGVLTKRRRQMRDWNWRILSGRSTLERLRSQVSRAKLEGRPYRLVIVDHLGLVRATGSWLRRGRAEFLEEVVAELKALAEEYGFTLLLVSQLSRPASVASKEVHEAWLRPPIQGDLKGASGIEQIATSVIFVYRRMVKATGKFDGQQAALLFPFHRSKAKPEPLRCEFVLPERPGVASVSAYRFEPVSIEPDEPTPAVAAVQQSLSDSFGDVTLVKPDTDDEIPF